MKQGEKPARFSIAGTLGIIVIKKMRDILILLTFGLICSNAFGQKIDNVESSSGMRIEFYEPDYDTIRNFQEIEIGSEKYNLEILFYSLNDSLVPLTVIRANAETGRLIDSAIVMTHNNQGKINLTKDNEIIFSEIIDKTILKDTLPEDYYKIAAIWKLKLERVEGDKIHFSTFVGSPEGDIGFYTNYVIGLVEKKLRYYFPEETEEEF